MAAAQRFLDRLSPLDQVAFIAYPEPGPRVNFTSDKLKLRLAMQALIGQAQRVPRASRTSASPKRWRSTTAAIRCPRRRGGARMPRPEPDGAGTVERDIITQSAEIARRVREDADFSVNGLRRLLQELSTVRATSR